MRRFFALSRHPGLTLVDNGAVRGTAHSVWSNRWKNWDDVLMVEALAYNYALLKQLDCCQEEVNYERCPETIKDSSNFANAFSTQDDLRFCWGSVTVSKGWIVTSHNLSACGTYMKIPFRLRTDEWKHLYIHRHSVATFWHPAGPWWWVVFSFCGLFCWFPPISSFLGLCRHVSSVISKLVLFVVWRPASCVCNCQIG